MPKSKKNYKFVYLLCASFDEQFLCFSAKITPSEAGVHVTGYRIGYGSVSMTTGVFTYIDNGKIPRTTIGSAWQIKTDSTSFNKVILPYICCMISTGVYCYFSTSGISDSNSHTLAA